MKKSDIFAFLFVLVLFVVIASILLQWVEAISAWRATYGHGKHWALHHHHHPNGHGKGSDAPHSENHDKDLPKPPVAWCTTAVPPSSLSEGTFNWALSKTIPKGRLQYMTSPDVYGYVSLPLKAAHGPVYCLDAQGIFLQVPRVPCKDFGKSGCRARAEFESDSFSVTQLQAWQYDATFIVDAFPALSDYADNERWKNSIVVFQLFSSKGAFAELYWTVDGSDTSQAMLRLKWPDIDGQENHVLINTTPKLGLKHSFSVQASFQKSGEQTTATVQVNAGTTTSSVSSLTLESQDKYYFKSGLYLQQDGKRDARPDVARVLIKKLQLQRT